MENSFYVLLLVLFLLTILTFLLTDFDILHPVCIVMCMMTLSVFLASTKIERWHLYMSVDASLLIISSLCSFVVGGIWTDWKLKKNIGGVPVRKESAIYEISTRNIFLIASVVLLLGYFQYRDFFSSSVALGNNSGPLDFSSMIRSIRPSIENESFRFSRWTFYRLILAQACIYCCLFVWFTRIVKNSGRVSFSGNYKYFLPVVAFTPFVLSTTGRTIPLNLILFMLLTGAIVFQVKNRFSFTSKLGIVCLFIGSGIVFFAIFLGMGFLSGKVSAGGRSPYEILVHYVGLSMPAFSSYLEQAHSETLYIGSTTLVGIYNNLNRLGADLPSVNVFLPFVQFNDISTNVYTMMARYVHDYGIVGMHIIMAVIGIVFTGAYDYIRLIAKKYEWIPYYGLFPETLFFSTNDDRFLSQVLSTTSFYQCVALFVVCKICISKRGETKEPKVPST